MGVSIEAFRKQLATKSGRSGRASAATNASVPVELWGHHGEWKSWEAQKRYMKSGTSRLMSVSQAAMATSMTPAPDVRIEVESADAPLEMAEGEQPPGVVGIPTGALLNFAWS